MNVNTGYLRTLEEYEMPNADEVPVNIHDMTDYQKRLMKVSPHDNRSPAGLVFTANRKQRREEEKRARRSKRGGDGKLRRDQ